MAHIDPKDIKIVLPLNALNDVNGNPRLYLVFYDNKGQILDVKKYSFMYTNQAIVYFYGQLTDVIVLPQIITPYKYGQKLYKSFNS